MSWVRGMAAGLKHPIDRSSSSFVPPPDHDSDNHAHKVAEVVLRQDRPAS
jgi:hypothetical protein